METIAFQELIWQQGRELYRDMPWRDDTRAYYVLVSEIMLQQTQVERVKVKFHEFISLFPDIATLANASLADVLTVWSGLGYNRRAKFLHEAARSVVRVFEGIMPQTKEDLMSLPGVGVNTAGAIMAYSFNQPVVFIETNIRTVYFYHFFKEEEQVNDKELQVVVEQTLDHEHPREWYWALMDYGSFLKRNGAAALDKSKHYKKQSPLKGSVREVRGLILKELAKADTPRARLKELMPDDERFELAIAGLAKDGLIESTNNYLHLARVRYN
jgi:A/G-specific adenine glycosylase